MSDAVAGEDEPVAERPRRLRAAQRGQVLAVADDHEGRAACRAAPSAAARNRSARLIGTMRPTNVTTSASSGSPTLAPERPVQLVVAVGRHDQALHVEADRDHLDLRRGRATRRSIRSSRTSSDTATMRSQAWASVALDQPERVLLADGRSSRAGRGRGTCARRPACARGARPTRPTVPALAPCVWTTSGRRRRSSRRHSRSDWASCGPSSRVICLQHDPLDAELVGDRLHRSLARPRLAVHAGRSPSRGRWRNAVVLMACRTDPPTDRREISWTARGIPRVGLMCCASRHERWPRAGVARRALRIAEQGPGGPVLRLAVGCAAQRRDLRPRAARPASAAAARASLRRRRERVQRGAALGQPDRGASGVAW